MKSKSHRSGLLTIAICLSSTAIVWSDTFTSSNGFEADAGGWTDTSKVASGTGGITSDSGSSHGIAASGAFTRWGGYKSVFPAGGYTTSVDVYLDLASGAANDTRVDFSSAINGTTGAHRRDFVFNGGFYNDSDVTGSGPRFVFSSSNGALRGNAYPKNPARSPIAITTSGWYTLEHVFTDNAGVLSVTLNIRNAANSIVGTWTLSDPTDLIGTTVGGNRYGWFALNEFTGGLAVDNSKFISSDLPSIANVTQSTYHFAISSAVGEASPGDIVELAAQTYAESALNVNKALTLRGPNVGIAGAGARVPEARLSDMALTITAPGVTLDGLEIYQTNGTSDAVLLQAASTVRNSVIRREGAVAGQFVRGITTAVGISGVTISGNLFTGDPSSGVFSGHKSWQSGIYSNGGSAAITGNTFENCRAALNLDDFNPGIGLTGNEFHGCGTYVSFGGVSPTGGSYTIAGNNFDLSFSGPALPDGIFNNSNVAANFRIDATGNTFGGIATGDLTNAQKFAIESHMYHRGRSGRNGVIDYVAGQQIEIAGTTLQSAVDAASTGQTVLIGGNITLNSQVTVNKQLTFDGDNKSATKISGSNALASYFMLFAGASGSSIVQNISFEKTDKAGPQNLIGLQSPNITFQNCDFTGQYVLGDPDVSRAFEISSGATGFSITNCSVIGLRQPGYINSVASGLIQDNYVAGTRGWVIDGGLVTFTGNTWGQGGAANAVDIALLASTPFSPLYDPLATLSSNNNGATISNQRTSVKVVNLTQGSGHPTIQSAIDAATNGDILEAYAGSFAETVAIGKPLTINGPNASIAGTGSRLPEAVVTGRITITSADDVTIQGLKITNPSDTIAIYGKYSSGLTVHNNVIDGVNTGSTGTGEGVYVLNNNSPISDIEISGNLIQNIGSSSATVSVKGIHLGDTPGTSTISNVLIKDNTIQGVTVGTKGAYGILLNYGASSPTGQVTGLEVSNNTISGLTGSWVHAIGLETDTGAATVNHNVISGLNAAGADEIGIFFEDNPTAASAVVRQNSFSADTNFGVAIASGTPAVDATENYWGDASGPAGAGAKAGPDVAFSPWYADAGLTMLRYTPVNTEVTGPENYSDLYIPAGTVVTVTPTGSIDAAKLELADGAELVVNEGDLTIGDDTTISGTFTIFNSFGSWNINGNTTFTIGQSLALISDIHVAAGKTLTVNGGGELILDGCVINSQTPGSPYNITTAADGLLTMARNVVEDANIDINTSSASVAANLVSRVHDNSFATSDIEATADAKVYHNLFDAATDSAANTDATTAFAAIDGWANVTSPAALQNKFTLDFAAPAAPGRTLDSDGNLFVKPADAVGMKLDVSALGSNAISAAEALLGYNSNMLTLTGVPTVVTPAGDWEVIAETAPTPSGLGLVDSALGLQLEAGEDGITADSNIAVVNFTAGNPGLTLGFFRVQTNRVFAPDGSLVVDTRLTKSVGGLPSLLASFTANTGELVIDNEKPVIATTPVTGTQIQPSQVAPVDILVPANRVFRNGTPVVLTFTASDNGHGLAGLDAADVDNDLVLTASNGSTTLDSSNYTVAASDSGGVLTYTVTLGVPITSTTGTYTISATVQDRSGNVSDPTPLGDFIVANEALVNVELQGFDGTTRDVTFVATGGITTTWTKTITNFVAGTGYAILEDVPAGTNSISAKTAWTLRSKVAASFSPEGAGTASLTGVDKLIAGDITGDNIINTLDYSVLRYNWLTFNPVSDITGSNGTGTPDYNLMKTNFYTVGDPQ